MQSLFEGKEIFNRPKQFYGTTDLFVRITPIGLSQVNNNIF